MNVNTFHAVFQNELRTLYSIEEITHFYYWLLEHYCQLTRLECALNPNQSIEKTDQDPLFIALNGLKIQQPIQYIIGEVEFYGLPFKINKNVLIPRPETEELVTWILETALVNSNILDIGTGSGCIAITLAKHITNAKVYAMDIFEQALIVANQNAKLNAVTLQTIKADILNTSQIHDKMQGLRFDIIVSNPPYVREKEKALMQANVLDFEPHTALFVSDLDPLIFYKNIIDLAKTYLNPNGELFFEINEYLANDMISLFDTSIFNTITIKQDAYGKNRMLYARKNDY